LLIVTPVGKAESPFGRVLRNFARCIGVDAFQLQCLYAAIAELPPDVGAVLGQQILRLVG
jgi:hypothetical protein